MTASSFTARAGAQVPLADPIALLFDDLAELERHAEAAAAVAESAAQNGHAARASAPARRRAEELRVDLEPLPVNGLIRSSTWRRRRRARRAWTSRSRSPHRRASSACC